MTSRVGPQSLREYLQRLRAAGELCEVTAEVDPDLEIAEIHRRVIAADGPALWFRHVRGSPYSVVTNLFGSSRRLALAFGGDPESFVKDAVGFVQDFFPPTPGKLWAARSFAPWLFRLGRKRVRRGPVMEVVESPPRLDQIPVTKSWIEDGGAFMTLPLVYTEDPDHGTGNLGIYRMQRYDRESTGMHWQIGKGGGFHHYRAEQRGEALPVTVFLGGPPAALVGALAPLPENVPELLLASVLLGKRLAMAKTSESPHHLLASAEWCLSGEVRPGERKPEGPFGDHYGYYSLIHDFPVFHCRRVYRRKDPIYPATVVGKPRQEDFYLGDALQDLLRPLFPLVMPGVCDLWSYGETGYHSLAGAIVRERYKREAMASAFRILGEGQLSLTKFLLVTDGGDLRDFRGVLERVLARTRLETDLYVFSNLSMDTLDYAGPRLNEGSKGVLLGIGEPIRELPREVPSNLGSPVTGATVFCPGCLVVEGDGGEDLPQAIARIPELESWPLVVLSNERKRSTASVMNFLWSTFTRFDPARDLHSASPRVESNHIVRSMPLVLDARMKSSYPDELFCDDVTARTVDSRWREYFPGGQEMGDSHQGHLASS